MNRWNDDDIFHQAQTLSGQDWKYEKEQCFVKNAKERSDFIFFFLFWEKEIISKTRIIILSHSFNKRKSKIILKWNDEISATEK